MGIKRFLRRSIGGDEIIDTIKNIIDEASIVDGIKRTLKEDLCEDNPITSMIYRVGHHDGKKEGYSKASYEYEKKLLEQADIFLEQKKIFENERVAYEALLDEYEKEIDILTEKANRTEEENIYLQELLIRDRKLRKMVS